jgi:two-component system OmpR family response regulator
LPHALLGCPRSLPLNQWLGIASASLVERKWMMMLDIDESIERARMLRLGFGDALGRHAGLEELETRVVRLTEQAEALPRYRHHGPVRLDLLAREAFVAGRALGLHPREFALLWRLAETPGEGVTSAELLTDVWRLSFRPETNSLAVHVSRLRAKLRLAGVDGIVETADDARYRLALFGRPSMDRITTDWGLDAPLRLGEIQPVT